MRWLVGVMLCCAGCASVQKVPLVRETRTLDNGRFSGPVVVAVPKHAAHQGHDYEVRVRLTAKCDPRFTLAFPDGEQKPFGVDDERWQALLTARAGVREDVEATVAAPQPPPPTPQEPAAPMTPAPYPQPVDSAPMMPGPYPQPSNPAPVAQAGVDVDAAVRIPAPTVGRWQRTVTEQWAGQVEFEAQRAQRCASERTFTAWYRNAFDDTDTVALWADVPQELQDATLVVEVDELVPPKVHPPKAVEVRAEVHAEVRPAKPRPPMPPPKEEHPPAPRDPNARWRAGFWEWSGGAWEWFGGQWEAPAQTPALRVENGGPPPLPGCVWVRGYWVWVSRIGGWDWVPGHWGPPPPLDEPRENQPDPTAPWTSGQWVSIGATFRWEPGRWGRPQPRAETPPPQPNPDSRWVEGQWLLVAGRWVWSPGFWDLGMQPPPLRAETVPPRPSPDAVWLRGFWRWDTASRTHVWIDGHWELPPGEGYVWVEEKLGPDLILRGHWEFRGVIR